MQGTLTRAAVALALVACASEPDAPARLSGATCPARMAHLPALDACIDRYEAVVEGAGRRAVAEPAQGRLPTTAISWFDARLACQNAGHRLCTAREWALACAGTLEAEGARAYPYGAEHEPERCNFGADGTDLTQRRLAPGGSFEGCVTPEGVFDLSGNLGEWLADEGPGGNLRELRGGSYATYPEAARCVPHPLAHQPPDVEFDGMGFRCCADAR